MATEDDKIDDARAEIAEAIAKVKSEPKVWIDQALSLIEKCYGDREVAREIWDNAFEEAVRIAEKSEDSWPR